MPKGDADILRADLDDGYGKIANLLLEALSCAPFTGSEYAVCLFVMRRTYGWAKGKDRDSGKLDTITADEIAYGTNTPRSTIHKAIRQMVKLHVLISEPVETGNLYAYGMNPDVASWGDGGPDWKQAKTRLREARERETYSRNRTDPSIRNRTEVYPKSDRGLSEIGQRSIRNRTEVGDLNACGTGTHDALQTVLQTVDRQSTEWERAPEPPPYPSDDELQAQQGHMAGAETLYRVAYNHWSDSRAPNGNDNWAAGLVSAMKQEEKQPDSLTEQEVKGAFASHPPLPSEWPDKWLARVRFIKRGDPRRQKQKDVEAQLVSASESQARPPSAGAVIAMSSAVDEEEHQQGLRQLQEAREALERHGRLAVNQ